MSIYYSGTLTRSSGVISAIHKQLKLLNLRPVKKILVQFDPFHPKAVTARDFLYNVSTPKVVETNLNCIIRSNIVCDRSDPEIKVDLTGDVGSLKFLANNLTVLEILQQLNIHIKPLIKEEEAPASVLATKIKKKVLKKR